MKHRPLDLAGKKFGRLTAIEAVKKAQNGAWLWKCLCDCGKEVVREASVIKRKIKSCGCSKRRLNLIGKRFGKIRVLYFSGTVKNKKGHNVRTWKCSCDCGKKVVIKERDLKSDLKSCGCLRQPNLLGKRFGFLTVVGIASKDKHRGKLWKCLCDCGKETFCYTMYLNAGKKTSCGCPRGRIHVFKLTEAKVRGIKKLLAAKFSINKLAAMYKVHKSSIARIRRGESWKHVKV